MITQFEIKNHQEVTYAWGSIISAQIERNRPLAMKVDQLNKVDFVRVDAVPRRHQGNHCPLEWFLRICSNIALRTVLRQHSQTFRKQLGDGCSIFSSEDMRRELRGSFYRRLFHHFKIYACISKMPSLKNDLK